MITTQKYFKRYRKELEHWLALRGLPITGASEVPNIGLVAFDGDRMIAAGFLRRCEGNTVLIDSVCSNPQASPELRHEALDMITENLISIAKTMDCTQVLAFTVDQNTIKRANKHGLIATPHQVLILTLSPKG